MVENKIKEVRSALEAQCAKREYCVSDIRRKALERLEGDSQAAEEVVSSLIGEKFVDDARYASAFAREKASLQGWGPVKIRYQLRAKGIGEADISAALQEVDSDKASARLKKLLELPQEKLESEIGDFRLKSIPNGNYMVEICTSRDGQFVAVLLLQFVNMNYEPVSAVCIYEGPTAQVLNGLFQTE